MSLALALLLFQAAPAEAVPAAVEAVHTEPAPERQMVTEDACQAGEADEVVVCGRPSGESPYRLPSLAGGQQDFEGVAPIVVQLWDGTVITTMPVQGLQSTGAGIGIKVKF